MNTFLKSVRALRDAMPNHKLELTQIGNTNYITCKPIHGLAGFVEMAKADDADMNYITSLNMFVSMVKGNNLKLYK